MKSHRIQHILFTEKQIRQHIDLCTLESYGSALESSGNVCITKDVSVDLHGAHVLLVDDSYYRELPYIATLDAEAGDAT